SYCIEVSVRSGEHFTWQGRLASFLTAGFSQPSISYLHRHEELARSASDGSRNFPFRMSECQRAVCALSSLPACPGPLEQRWGNSLPKNGNKNKSEIYEYRDSCYQEPCGGR